METRTNYQKVLLILLAALPVIFAIGILIVSRQMGIVFQDGFLRRISSGAEEVYAGTIEGEKLTVTITPGDPETVVDLRTDEGWQRTYQVRTDVKPPAGEWQDLIGVQVLEDGEVLFRGGYQPQVSCLVDENGDVTGLLGFSFYSNQFWESFEPSVSSVVRLALDREEVSRGSWLWWLAMVFFTGLLAVDIAFPRAYFYLQHHLSVRDPEPTEFYCSMQRIMWPVLTFFLLIGYWYALFYLE